MVGKGLGVHDDVEGNYKGWSSDEKHRRESQVLGVFRDIWPDRGGDLPWRLTQAELKELDERMKNIVWPHYIDRLYYDRCSFWVKASRMWKTARKVVFLPNQHSPTCIDR